MVYLVLAIFGLNIVSMAIMQSDFNSLKSETHSEQRSTIKRDRLSVKREGPKLLGGICETAGQFAYIFAIGDEAHTGSAAAIISCYCVLSVVWSRIFLKEKLSWKHYVSIAIAVCGIAVLGFFDA